MFKWNNMNGAANTDIVEEDYSIENNGHLVALAEAFDELAEINESLADINAQAIDAYADGYKDGGESGAQAAMEAFVGTPVMEGFLGDAKDKIVNALKKLWAKIKAFFKSALAYFDAIFMSGKKFADKYKEEILKNDLSGFKYEMFEYTLDAIDLGSVYTKAHNELGKKAVAGQVGNRKEAVKSTMQALCGAPVRDNAAFHKELAKKLRGGRSEKKEITPDISKIINELADNDALQACKDAQSNCDDLFQTALDNIQKGIDHGVDKNNADATRNARDYYAITLEAKSLGMTVFDAYKSAVKERESSYKGCLSKALHFTAKK